MKKKKKGGYSEDDLHTYNPLIFSFCACAYITNHWEWEKDIHYCFVH